MKKSVKAVVWLSSVGTLSSLVAGGCSDFATDCENTLTCDVPGDGDGDLGGNPGDGDGDGDGTGGGGGGAPSACDPECDGSEPHCDDTEDPAVCVECLNEGDCTGSEQCNEDGECVGCLESEHCEDPALPMCEDGECAAGCENPGDCARFEEALVCDEGSGACVECTVATDDRTSDTDDCGTGVCNPDTRQCEAGLTQGAKEACESCIADNECEADYNCVPMVYKGTPRAGGYCLRTLASGACSANPYRSPTPARASLSGATAEVYCGLNESYATCEAFLDLDADKSCSSASECGAPGLNDGLCETVTTVDGKCTYECTGVAQCPTDDPGAGCAGDAEGDAGSFCGGLN